MRILVTGLEGQIARSLAERGPLQNGFEVCCVGRPELDLMSPRSIVRVIVTHAPDIVVAAAAYTDVDRAEEEVDIAMRINGAAAGEVARAARQVGARLLYVSTDYVYDGWRQSAYVESDATGPQNVYGRTKLEGERRVLAEMPAATILRTSWVVSPFGNNFVKTMLALAATRDRLTVVDDQHGNPTSALDFADAIFAIAHAFRTDPNRGAGQIYHCAGSGSTTWRGLADQVFVISRACGGPVAEVSGITTQDYPTKASRPRNSRLDCSKIAKDFGWRAPDWRASIETIVRRLLADTDASDRMRTRWNA